MENVHQSQEIALTPAAWCAELEAWISQAKQHASVNELRDQVENGGARLFSVTFQGQTVGAFILRIDQTADGAEGVIVAGAGHLPGYDFTLSLVPHIEKLFHGVTAYRIHTARPAMAKRLARAGYTAAEMVFRKTAV